MAALVGTLKKINKSVENKKRERKQRLKVSKIALYNIFNN